MNSQRSFLRWAGSKRQLLPVLASLWEPTCTRYVEPFMGSACLFFHLHPRQSLLSDINESLVDAFTVIRNRPSEVYDLVGTYPVEKEFYYELRSVDISTLNEVQRAARFLFLNRFCYNGLYRTNKKGLFNVPFSNSKTGAMPGQDELKAAAKALQNSDIRCCDFMETITNVRAGDFVYLDPPYAIKNTRIFHQYDPQSFGLNDIEKIESALTKIDDVGATFVMSYANSAEMDSLKNTWPHIVVTARRNIAGFSDKRKTAEEVIISNSSRLWGANE